MPDVGVQHTTGEVLGVVSLPMRDIHEPDIHGMSRGQALFAHKPDTRMDPGAALDMDGFVSHVIARGEELYRDFPWRNGSDPYAVLVSEVMLQQTQVSRVERYYGRWLAELPTFSALAEAPLAVVLGIWQGLGYNRRAVLLANLAQTLVADAAEKGVAVALPSDEARLRALPGIGPATAAGVRVFAFNELSVYLETNARAVFLHEFFPEGIDVSDAQIRPIAEHAGQVAICQGSCPRQWNYALLDYGAHLKKTVPNPSRRSRHHVRQSRFEGSKRQKRARLLKLVLADPGITTEDAVQLLSDSEAGAGRGPVSVAETLGLLEELVAEGFFVREGDAWSVP